MIAMDVADAATCQVSAQVCAGISLKAAGAISGIAMAYTMAFPMAANVIKIKSESDGSSPLKAKAKKPRTEDFTNESLPISLSNQSKNCLAV